MPSIGRHPRSSPSRPPTRPTTRDRPALAGDIVRRARPTTPACAARTLVTAVARSRRASAASAQGRRRASRRGTACGSCRAARAGPTPTSRSSPRSIVPVLVALLAEADAGVDDRRATERCRRPRPRRRARGARATHLGRRRRRTGARAYMSVEWSAPVPGARRRRRSAATAASISGSAMPPGHVVHDPGARLDGGDRGGRVHRVDAHERRPRPRAPRTTGSTRSCSTRGIDPLGAGPGRFAADVERCGRPASRSRSPCAIAASASEVASAVAERVGGAR